MMGNMKKVRPLIVGGRAPVVPGRTDEGTPISLADFKGRALAVFLIGKGYSRDHRTLLNRIRKSTSDFMEMDVSPVVISGEAEEVLSSLRESLSLPYLMMSDRSMSIHKELSGGSDEGVWVFDARGRVASVVPAMGPKEQVGAVLAALNRVGNIVLK